MWKLSLNQMGQSIIYERKLRKLGELRKYILGFETAAISLRLQGKLSFPYNCQKMNGQIYVLLC